MKSALSKVTIFVFAAIGISLYKLFSLYKFYYQK